jgi:glycosyltransferase involved in cell wall biosynthesis
LIRLNKYYRSRNIVVVGYDFHSEGGAWRSIYRYFRHAEALGQTVMLIDRRKQRTFRQLLAAVCFSPRILFNGIGTFCRWEGILACLLRKDILIYLHETAYMIDLYARQHPWKLRLFRWILKRNAVLCVSEQMQEYYRKEFGVHRSHVVREAVALPTPPDFESTCRHIVMVGSLDERKGVPLFSEVAALAATKGLQWRFHWIGAKASQSLGALSDNVRWWGWQDTPLEFVRRADLFFLSSVDDPLPLACLEAMALGKRCVVYRQTGIAEMIDGVQGCAVFETYTAAEAFHALEKVLLEVPDNAALIRIVEEKASVAALTSQVQRIAGIA